MKTKRHQQNLKMRDFLNSYFPCPKCQENFTSEADLKIHLINLHTFTLKGKQKRNMNQNENYLGDALAESLSVQNSIMPHEKEHKGFINHEKISSTDEEEKLKNCTEEKHKTTSKSNEKTLSDNFTNPAEEHVTKECNKIVKITMVVENIPSNTKKECKEITDEEKVSLEESLNILTQITSEFINRKRQEKTSAIKDKNIRKISIEKEMETETKITNMKDVKQKETLKMIRLVEASLKGEDLKHFKKIVKQNNGSNASHFKQSINDFTIKIRRQFTKKKLGINVVVVD